MKYALFIVAALAMLLVLTACTAPENVPTVYCIHSGCFSAIQVYE